MRNISTTITTTGISTTISSAATGTISTDTIWDSAGDLAVGTGPNAAARLAMGTALQSLRVNAAGTGLEYANPSGGGDALTTGTIDQFADVTQGVGAVLSFPSSGTHSGTNTGDQDLSSYATTAAVAAAYQPLDTQLTSLAGLVYAGNMLKLVRVNGAETGFELASVTLGDVTVDGTPSDNQLAIWTAADSIEGNANLTFDHLTNTLTSVAFKAPTFQILDTNDSLYYDITLAFGNLLVDGVAVDSGAAALITGYVSAAGTVAATDTIVEAIEKLNGNDALALPKAGGTMTASALHTEVTNVISANAATITLANGNHQTLTLAAATGAVTVTLTAPSSAGAGTLVLLQDDTARDVTWSSAATILWAGTEPTWASDAVSSYRVISWRYDGTRLFLSPTEVFT